MPITEVGQSGVCILLAGGASYPGYMAIGSGSGITTNATGLYAEISRKIFTDTDTSTLRKITWVGDWNSFEMSGLELTEFGILTGSPGSEMWHYENLGNPITFDGTNELRIEIIWEVI